MLRTPDTLKQAILNGLEDVELQSTLSIEESIFIHVKDFIGNKFAGPTMDLDKNTSEKMFQLWRLVIGLDQ